MTSKTENAPALESQAPESQKALETAQKPLSSQAQQAQKAREALKRNQPALKEEAPEAEQVEKTLNPPPAREQQRPRRPDIDPELKRAGTPATSTPLQSERKLTIVTESEGPVS